VAARLAIAVIFAIDPPAGADYPSMLAQDVVSLT